VPRVDSTVLRIEPLVPPPLTAAEEADLRQLTRAAFAWRRKQLQKTLRRAPEYALDAATVQTIALETGIDLEQRPEQLEPASLVRLAGALRRCGRPLAQQS
jgi:16S rRNA (adenine1518-N6/adenine1519-N6)-dimethyltransferase